jgi:hypothetical protein
MTSADRLRHYDVGWTPHVFHLYCISAVYHGLAISLALSLAISLALTLGLSLVHSADPVSGQCTQPCTPWTPPARRPWTPAGRPPAGASHCTHLTRLSRALFWLAEPPDLICIKSALSWPRHRERPRYWPTHRGALYYWGGRGCWVPFKIQHLHALLTSWLLFLYVNLHHIENQEGLDLTMLIIPHCKDVNHYLFTGHEQIPFQAKINMRRKLTHSVGPDRGP